MFDDENYFMDLGSLSDSITEMIGNDYTYKKKLSQILKRARQEAKKEYCYICGKNVSSFCNSHSVPRFCLANIATYGKVSTLNAIIENPFLDTEKGINKAGTFHLICNECDSKVFADYEQPDNYADCPTPKMLAQMALKNSLKSISKRLLEIELFKSISKNSVHAQTFGEMKNVINEMDLKEYIDSYKKAKKALDKNSTSDYHVCYYKKLDYVVPIAFQSSLALIVDFNGNIINNVYDHSPKYKIQSLHISIFPLKSETVIVMFVENEDRRYSPFFKQLKKLPLDEQLAALTLIIYLYSEDMYFSNFIENEVCENKRLCEAARTSSDIVADMPFFDPFEKLKQSYSLEKRFEIPNLLSEKYKMTCGQDTIE